MSKLLDYLNTLDKDAAAREAHAKDPKAAMTKQGLTDEEQAAVLSGDKKKMATLIGIQEDSLPSVQVNISTF
ncbi:MAG: hypothetical protein Q7T62_12840 [Undibacterium sp.]|nr:hypothetical protein [Undibacterium sp.]